MKEKETFDSSKLTQHDLSILKEFAERRASLNAYLKTHAIKKFTCPGCGYPTLWHRGDYEICAVCNWEDDGQDDAHANMSLAGPNQGLTLTENRLTIGKTLLKMAVDLNGRINDNPAEIITALEKHEERMNSFVEEDMMDALMSDPIWKEWKRQSKEILSDLISK